MNLQKKILLWLILIWTFGISIQLCDCINILGIVTSSSKSNNLYTEILFNELANNGHSVRVLSPLRPQSQKIHHLLLDGFEKYKFDTYNSLWHNLNNEYEHFSMLNKNFHQYNKGLDRTKAIIQHKSFKKLLTSSYTVDIIIIDYDYNEALLGLSKFFNCPIIILSLGQLNISLRNLLNLSYPYRYINFYDYKNTINENSNNFHLINLFKRTISNFIEELFVKFYYYPSQKVLYENIFTDKIISTHTLDTAKYVNFDTDIRKKSIGKFFIITPALMNNLQLNDIIDVTGFHIKFNHDNNFLSENLDNFIHSSNDGCIYISFGYDINPSIQLPKNIILNIFHALNQRNENIIWSWNGNTTSFKNSKNFYISNNLPQNDILKHSNIKLIITSGGTLSLIESIYNEIPIIGIPITQEQSNMLDIIEEYDLGIKLMPNNVTINSLQWAINEIIENDRYRDNLYKKSQQIQDRPLTPMKTVKYWIEYVYRHRYSYKTYNQNFHHTTSRISIQQQQQQQQNNNKNNDNLLKIIPSHLEYYFLNIYLISFIILVITVIAIVVIIKFTYNFIVYLLMARKKLKIY